jgi:hypothetical protein
MRGLLVLVVLQMLAVACGANETAASRQAPTTIRSGRTPTGGHWVLANRNDYAATIEFVGAELPKHCGGRVTYGCSDNVWVHRVEVPQVLTGD